MLLICSIYRLCILYIQLRLSPSSSRLLQQRLLNRKSCLSLAIEIFVAFGARTIASKLLTPTRSQRDLCCHFNHPLLRTIWSPSLTSFISTSFNLLRIPDRDKKNRFRSILIQIFYMKLDWVWITIIEKELFSLKINVVR